MVFFVFFFHAEDGIRDDLVTGVQTCALPICQSAILHLSGFLACFIPEELESRTLNFVQELGVRSFVRRAFWLQESSPRLLPTTSQRYERSGQQTDSEIGRASCRERVKIWGGRG